MLRRVCARIRKTLFDDPFPSLTLRKNGTSPNISLSLRDSFGYADDEETERCKALAYSILTGSDFTEDVSAAASGTLESLSSSQSLSNEFDMEYFVNNLKIGIAVKYHVNGKVIRGLLDYDSSCMFIDIYRAEKYSTGRMFQTKLSRKVSIHSFFVENLISIVPAKDLPSEGKFCSSKRVRRSIQMTFTTGTVNVTLKSKKKAKEFSAGLIELRRHIVKSKMTSVQSAIDSPCSGFQCIPV